LKSKTVLSSNYLPCVEYFTYFLEEAQVCIDIHENYQKQSSRSRTYLLSANGIQMLSIPVQKGTSQTKKAMKDIKIDYSEKWQKEHWRAICSNYGKSPFFEYFVDYFEKIYSQNYSFLLDLNENLLTTCLNLINLPQNLEKSKKYIDLLENKDIIDPRGVLNKQKPFVTNKQTDSPCYIQIFGKSFVANMSILDVLFCEGTNTLTYLKQYKHYLKQ